MSIDNFYTRCNAKGNEYHLWLHWGNLASCCKSTPVKLTHSELENIFNHPEIEKQKQNLNAGIRDPSCNYCWALEKNGATSLRNRRNEESPNRLLEISFDDTCNFYCLYCNPGNSSKWRSIIDNNESKILKSKYQTKSNLSTEFNYNALPDIIKQGNVNVLSFVGGEPLMSKRFFKFLQDYKFESSVQYNLVTNLCPDTDKTLDLFLEKTKDSKVTFSVSLDSGLDAAEIIRVGFKKEKFLSNLEKILNSKQITEIKFLNTVSSLSIFDEENFIKFVDSVKEKTKKKVMVNYSLLVYPDYLSLHTLDKTAIDYLDKNLRNSSIRNLFSNEKKQNKIYQRQLVNFLVEMAPISGIDLTKYDELTQGMISRINS